MRSSRHRWAAAPGIGLLVLTATACSSDPPDDPFATLTRPSFSLSPPVTTPTPSPTVTPTVTLRATAANDVRLDGADPCALVADAARATRAITVADPDRGVGDRGPICGFRTAAGGAGPNWAVSFYLDRPTQDFRAILRGSQDTVVADYAALTLLEGGPGSNNVDVACSFAVSTAPDQTLVVRSDLLAAAGADAACADARDLTTGVLGQLNAQR